MKMFCYYKIGLLLLVAGTLGAGQARADLMTNSPYSLSISESSAVLAQPDNPVVAALAAMKSGVAMAVERSEPYLLLTNTSTSTLTNFEMTIGNLADHFTFVHFVSGQSSSGVSMTNSTGTDMQDLSIVTSLAPGQSLEFRVGLAPNDPGTNPLVSYGHVFFNNDPTGSAFNPAISSMTESNSVVTVTFAHPTSSITGIIGDQANIDAASALTTAANCDCGNHGVGVTAFNVAGDGTNFTVTGTTPVVTPTPEPSSVVLLGMGLLGLGSVAWRKRRAAQSQSL